MVHTQKKDKMGIRGKILLTFTIMALIPLILIGFFTTISITDLGDKSVDDSTAALKEQANSDLKTLLSDNAVLVEQFLKDAESDTEFLKDFGNDVYNHPEKYEVTGYPDFHYAENIVSYLPDWGYIYESNDERNGAWADWDLQVQVKPYLNSSVVNRASQDPEYAKWLRNELNLTLLFDQVLKPLYKSNKPNIELVWMVRHGGLTNAYEEPALDYGQLLLDEDISDDWDEDEEDYVTMANPNINPDRKIVWVDPYYDTAGNDWIISSIGPIYKGNEFIGTVGLDINLNVILNSVLDISIYKTGHAFMITTTGNTVAHKDLESVREQQIENDEDNTDVDIRKLESESQEFSNLINEMANSESGLETVTYENGEKSYIGYQKIPGTQFILGIVVPEAEVIESVEATKDSIAETTNFTFLLVIGINGIALFFILVIGLALANRIVSPINQMINISQKLGVGKIDDSILRSKHMQIGHQKAKGDEIGTLMTSFSKMVNSINQNVEEEKKLKKKESAPIPQQLIQDIKIEIKDSVIHRSSIGIPSKKSKPGETQYCLNCGKDLPADFSGQFCPYCGEEP